MEASIDDGIERAGNQVIMTSAAAERAARFEALLCWHGLFGWPALGEARRRHAKGLPHGLPVGHRPLELIATGFPS